MFAVWVKSRAGQVLVGEQWRYTYTWHRHLINLDHDTAHAEAKKITLTAASPAVSVRPMADTSLWDLGAVFD